MPRFLKILARNLLKGPSTEAFPFKEAFTPPRYRGKVVMNPNLCVGCGICTHVCPGGAIMMKESEDQNGYDFMVWHNTCAFCGSCRHYCPVKAISLSQDWHNAHYQSEKYRVLEHHFVPYLHCSSCGAHIRRLPPALAARIYSHSSVDPATIIRLCPDCRQLATAKREGEAHESSPAPRQS
ncbi:MAG: 4Fe-4S binding protein [Desulfovibrionaceae bacterium]|nr:4Fe-4S binding protein [Desulfovibrionaceae bacterium]